MSKGQIKRLHEQKELEKANLGEEEEEPVRNEHRGPVNRFAFFDDEEENESDENVNKSEEEEGEKKQPSAQKSTSNKKKAKKNKKKAKKVVEEVEETENQMLARLAALNVKEAKKAAAALEGTIPGMEELMKIDMKLFDIAAENKRNLGKAFKMGPQFINDGTASPGEDANKWPPGKRAIGRIVKNKPRWFPDRDYGLSMVSAGQEHGGVQWFKLQHNMNYRNRERMFWIAEKNMNVELVQEIFSDTPYHLNSLILMSHVYTMNEDVNQAADLIERGIFHVDQWSCPSFEPFNWRHRMDYTDYENRAFYLLLHRHMLNAAKKRCWETAWNTAKMIFKLDPERDPLAIMSIIDSFALRAKQYQWILNVYESGKSFKKLHLLPNWPYSVALAKFALAKNEQEKEAAKVELCSSICHFPSVVVNFIEQMQVIADMPVRNCKLFASFVAEKDPESLKTLTKIYVKQTEELWKIPENLLFLEEASRHVAVSRDPSLQVECDEWRARRHKMYKFKSPNVERLGELLDVLPSSSLTNPVPPANGRCAYTATSDPQEYVHPNNRDSFLGAFLHSLIPNYRAEMTMVENMEHHREHFARFVAEYVGHYRPGGMLESMAQVITRYLANRTDPPVDEDGQVVELPELPDEMREWLDAPQRVDGVHGAEVQLLRRRLQTGQPRHGVVAAAVDSDRAPELPAELPPAELPPIAEEPVEPSESSESSEPSEPDYDRSEQEMILASLAELQRARQQEQPAPAEQEVEQPAREENVDIDSGRERGGQQQRRP